MNPNERANEYDDKFVTRLELVWGEGFLSPGGADEVRKLLEGSTLVDKEVLDIGCGTGGVDLLLANEHGAKKVVGIDIEQPVLDRAIKRAKANSLDDKLEFLLVDPGPLPFDDDSFDIVFSKDAIMQLSDKSSLFADIFRVLRSGGKFIASDWLRSEHDKLAALQTFLEIIDFSADMQTPDASVELLKANGFVDIEVRDRTSWLREETRMENTLVATTYKEKAIELIGIEKYEAWLAIRHALLSALEANELRPSHLIATKPQDGN